MFRGFNPVSSSALKTMRATIRDLNIRRQTQLSLADIARTLDLLPRGWIEYYGRYASSALYPMPDKSSDAFALGDAEIRGIQGSQNGCQPFSAKAGSGSGESVRSLAYR
jgi:hypothetical protein